MPKNLLQDIKIKHQPVARVHEMEIRRKESQNERSIKKESSTKPARGTKYGVWIVAIISVFFSLPLASKGLWSKTVGFDS